MFVVCLDLEGVLVPEIWINVAEKTGIEKLRLTTRDIPDYDVLMKGRIRPYYISIFISVLALLLAVIANRRISNMQAENSAEFGTVAEKKSFQQIEKRPDDVREVTEEEAEAAAKPLPRNYMPTPIGEMC